MGTPTARREEAGRRRVSVIAGVGQIDDVRMYRGEKIVLTAERIAGHKVNRSVLGPPTAVDIYYALYLPVPFLDPSAVDSGDPDDLVRYSIIQNMMNQPDLYEIRRYTVADPVTSIVAAASIIEKLDRFMEKSSGKRRGGSRREESESSSRRTSGEQGGGSPSPRMNEKELSKAMKRALSEAVRDAKVAKEVKAAIAKFGAGSSSVLAFDDSAEVILRLARETDIMNVLRYIAGLRVQIREERRFMRHSRGWVKGVEYGGDLERLHPSQLALPDEVFYTEYAHNRLLLFEKALPAGRGPIYVLLDKSGSMIGEKIDWARAVALALLQRSVSEKRPFYARFFDSTVYPLIAVKKFNKPSEILKAIDYLARVKAGGGTRITNAIYVAANDIANTITGDKVSDIVLITDGVDTISIDTVLNAKKRASARLHTVMVMGNNYYLRKVSDHYMEVRRSLDKSSILKVVELVDEDYDEAVVEWG